MFLEGTMDSIIIIIIIIIIIKCGQNNSDFNEDIITPWRWSKTETCRSFLDGF